MRLLEGLPIDELDGGPDDHKGYRALLHGQAPDLRHFDTFTDEVAALGAYLKQAAQGDKSLISFCIVTRTTELLDQYESALNAQDIPTFRVKRSQAEDRKAPGLGLATMHRVKGLEYDRVIIAGVNHDIVPLALATQDSTDPVVQRESEVHERALLYVAATRAKQQVLVTSFGKPCRFLQNDPPA